VKLEKPGPWSFGVFAAACGVVVAMFYFKAPDAAKAGSALVGLVGTWVVIGPLKNAHAEASSEEDGDS
jgi:hypothetical protein